MYYIAGNEMKRMLAYPYIFEAQPGKLWITTGFGSLKIELQERNYLEN
jgi:hypothetical protein